jgi:hypothetical protein
MKISIESIYLNQEIIDFMNDHNLKLESFEISPNEYYDLEISGDFKNILSYLLKFGYIHSLYDLIEYIEDDLNEYLREKYDILLD